MRKPLLTLVMVIAVAAVGGGAWAIFETVERGGLAKRAEKACGSDATPSANAPTELPLGLPLTEGEKVLRVAEQGRTTVAWASEPGSRDDIVAVRDKVLADLRRAGYTVVGTDQEPGYEAEAELAGTHPGSVKVSPLCEGLLEVRYKIEL